ncbi:MAG: hypothetical protein ABR974_09510 [Bacteroidales bacterium]|jgi:hypothetical protein
MKEKALYWTPRILAILAILFMLMFSFDAFDGNEPLGRKLLGFLIHNIPVLILTAIVVVAWNRELPGGIILIAVAFCACIFFHSFTTNRASLFIFIPFMVTGVLFILHHLLYGKRK